jgi:Xaa-Pro aminopeptidase
METQAVADLTLEQAAHITPVVTLSDTEPAGIDLEKMRAYRLARVRRRLQELDYGACVLVSPYSIRYATGLRNCAIYQAHITGGYVFIPAEGPVVAFDGEVAPITGPGLGTIDEIRHDGVPLGYFYGGPRLGEWQDVWAAQMSDLIDAHCGGNRRFAVERVQTNGCKGFAAHNVEVVDAIDVIEPARVIKSPEEILCMNFAIAAAEDGMAKMRAELRPGVSEMELWSHLWAANAKWGGDWLECRLLTSGDRTNPWLQEASGRMIRAGELVAFDTDMVGPFGYAADVSRTYFCGPGKPRDEQRDLYKRAWDEIHFNMALMKPGMSFRDITQKSFQQPKRFRAQHYPVLAHGIGMSDEWPTIFYADDDARFGHDGELESGMTICVESYVGEVGGRQGVKLEQQIVITDSGYELLSRYPFEEDLLA